MLFVITGTGQSDEKSDPMDQMLAEMKEVLRDANGDMPEDSYLRQLLEDNGTVEMALNSYFEGTAVTPPLPLSQCPEEVPPPITMTEISSPNALPPVNVKDGSNETGDTVDHMNVQDHAFDEIMDSENQNQSQTDDEFGLMFCFCNVAHSDSI